MKRKMEYQIDTYLLKKGIKKYFPYAVILVLFLMLFVKCNDTKSLEAEKAVLQYQIIESNKKVSEKIKENEIIQKEIIKYKNTIAFLDTQNQKKQVEIDKLQKQRRESSSKVLQYTEDDLFKFYIERYKTNTQIFKTQKGIEFHTPITKQIASELTDYDYTETILEKTNEVLIGERKASTIKDSVINNLEVKEKNLNFVVKEKDFVIGNQDEIIKNQEKSLTKEKRKNKLYKYALPIGIITGIVTGVLITN
jgi:hypothetical protein